VFRLIGLDEVTETLDVILRGGDVALGNRPKVAEERTSAQVFVALGAVALAVKDCDVLDEVVPIGRHLSWTEGNLGGGGVNFRDGHHQGIIKGRGHRLFILKWVKVDGAAAQVTLSPNPKMNPDTTTVTGIVCKACGDELPPMTMTEHLNGKGCLCRKFIHSDDYADEFVVIDASDVCPGVAIKHPHKQLQQFIEDIKKEPKQEWARVFKRVWAVIKLTDVEKAYEKQGEAWGNLCDDIIIFYAYRWLLFNKPIPLIKMTPAIEEQIFGGDPQAVA
jgi:hypothetical protein